MYRNVVAEMFPDRNGQTESARPNWLDRIGQTKTARPNSPVPYVVKFSILLVFRGCCFFTVFWICLFF